MKKSDNDLPIGFSMGLAQNYPAFERFTKMNEAERYAEIEKARSVASKNEMNAIIEEIAKRDNQG